MSSNNMEEATEETSKKEGPIANSAGTPYDYIVIIDAGSSGSRAYVYNWLNGKSISSLEIVLDEQISYKLPQVRTEAKWHKKIKPGISSFNSSPGKVGRDHIKPLLKKITKIIPESQQYRTPIFLHATAGMRLLKPNEQTLILNNACKYIQRNYNFYLPDCASHINIIDGDVEGLYGWIALNYLMGSFDQPHLHDHGKNHSTYGLLDMGGASTQISFQPNYTEAEEHDSSLFKLQLTSLDNLGAPDMNYSVFSTSFLGFGIHQLHENYLQNLTNVHEQLQDPCYPKGLQDDDIVGTGNFSQCMDLTYPLLVDSETTSCSNKASEDISSCLLSDSLPSLDFDVDKFIGVSGYWDAISNMLGIDDISQYGNAYDYQSFYLETEKICETPWEELDHYNDEDLKGTFSLLSDSELSELCFKSSWILNVLHRGLGFPKLDSNSDIKPFQVLESINGSEFSWTLGRAVLYLTWENAMHNSILNNQVDPKVGYSHISSPNLFISGGENLRIGTRPEYNAVADTAEPGLRLQNHHYLLLLVLLVLPMVVYFVLGPKKRKFVYKHARKQLMRLPFIKRTYNKLNSDVELEYVRNNNNNTDSERQLQDIDDMFLIDEE